MSENYKSYMQIFSELKEYKDVQELVAALQQKNIEEVIKFIKRDYLVYRYGASYFFDGIFSDFVYSYFDLDLIKFLFEFLRGIESNLVFNTKELLLTFDVTKCLQSELLIFAIIYRKKEMIEFILSQEIDINYPNRMGMNPIFYAIRCLNEKVIYILLQKGAYFTSKRNNNFIVTIMNIEDLTSKFEMIELVLKYGYDPNIVDESGNTVLMELLLAMTKSFTAGRSPHHYQMIPQPEKILYLLLMNGVEPNIANKILNTTIVSFINSYELLINKNYRSPSYIELFKRYISLASVAWFKATHYNENNSEYIQEQALNNSEGDCIDFNQKDYYNSLSNVFFNKIINNRPLTQEQIAFIDGPYFVEPTDYFKALRKKLFDNFNLKIPYDFNSKNLSYFPRSQLIKLFLEIKEYETKSFEMAINFLNHIREDKENASITIPEGFSVKQIPKDGNCFYTSLASFLNLNPGDIRNGIAQFIQNNSNDYIDSIVENNIDQEVQTILTNGAWVTDVGVVSSARAYNIVLVIHYRDGETHRIPPQSSQPSNQEVHLLYDGTHYDLLIPNIHSDSGDMIIQTNYTDNNNPEILIGLPYLPNGQFFSE